MKTVGVISVFFMLNLFSFYGFAQNCPELTGVYDCDKRESSEWKYDYIIFTQKDIETETRRNLKYTQYSIKPTRFPESLENHRQGEVRLTDGRQRTAGHISYYDSESGNEKRFTVSYKATCKKSEAGLPQLWIQDSIKRHIKLR